MTDVFGELTIWGADPFTGQTFSGERKLPFFGCGHCSRPVVMHPGRVRERKRCGRCSRLVCDNEICDPMKAGCTPIYQLADDHFEADGDWNKLVPAIMSGATTLDAAEAARTL